MGETGGVRRFIPVQEQLLPNISSRCVGVASPNDIVDLWNNSIPCGVW